MHWQRILCINLLLILLFFKTQMFIHVYHRLIAFDLLIHINFEFSDSYQISTTKVIEVHDSRVLPVIVIKHSSYEVFVADGHVHEILSVPCTNATCEVQMVLVEI